MKKTKVTQPSIFLHSVILAKTMGGNFQPEMVAGHSVGEFAALVTAGAMTFEDGLKLVANRALAMQDACDAVPSTMAAIIGLDDTIIEEVCVSITDEVVVAGLFSDITLLALQAKPFDSYIYVAALGYLIILSLRAIFFIVKKVEGFGMGVAKLLALSGALVGVENVLMVILLACISTLIIVFITYLSKSKNVHQIPFGPGISFATVVIIYTDVLGLDVSGLF
jgi:Flp pilus assembly protein protease CpaA